MNEKQINSKLITKIIAWRDSSTKSYGDLANQAKIRRHTISNIISGKCKANIDTAIKILAVICKSLDEANDVLVGDYPEYRSLQNIA